ncbi:alkaline phosphatase [Paenibacillus kribbensis]|uniref:alkaline phosphatase n=1 Tax=Paenibacillus kribbensis TaxID=172713 RepID=UPI002DB9A2D1|nr:alkaline phosphatase [Paenibacillus kribbensis]MEC0235131.1 alkaline phosphatase [Paenibacillus kribbensis]
MSFIKKSVPVLLALSTTLTLAADQIDAASKELASQKSAAKQTAAGYEVEQPDTSRPLYEDYSKINDNKAKYVFQFIGDGMGVTPVTAAEQYAGKVETGKIEPKFTNFTEFPVVGLQNPYDCHSFIPDSASTATAYANGIKTQTDTVGMNGDLDKATDSVAEKAHRAGKKVGIITSVTLNHATPAGFYANVKNRNSYYDIGLQMAKTNFDYFAGGSLVDRTGTDGKQKDLYTVMEENGYTIADTKAKFNNVSAKTGKVYAISERLQDEGSTPYAMDTRQGDQTLADFVQKGIDVMKDDKDGFFMMVESGKIDWAEHANDAKATITEVNAFQDSINKAIEFYNEHPDETLIVVTADHATGGFTIGNTETGYETYYDLLEAQKESYVEFDNRLAAMKEKKPNLTLEDVTPLIKQSFGLKLDPNVKEEIMTFAEREALKTNENKVDTSGLSGEMKKVAEKQNKDAAASKKDPYLLTESEYHEMGAAFKETMKAPEDRIDSQETLVRYGGYEPLTITATRILNKKAGLAWTTVEHTGEKIPVYAIGASAKMFDGHFDNTDIAIRLNAAMDQTNK